MNAFTVIILAAGEGTRMRSDTPKVLHPLCGRPLVLWPVVAAREAGAGRVIVVDNPTRRLADVVGGGVETVVQAEPLGTAHAVMSAAELIDPEAPVVILSGDVPLITPESISALLEVHAGARAAATIATMVLEDASGYGRVVRSSDGSVDRVVETKTPGDASPEELAIDEVNTGIFAFDGAVLVDALRRVEPANAQGEFYLPDVLPILRSDGRAVAAHRMPDPTLTLGVNDRVDLARVRIHAQKRIHDGHARAGVTIVDPSSTVIDVDVVIGLDSVIEPSSFLRGTTVIGERCTIGPLSTIINCSLGDEVTVPHSYLTGARVADRGSVGPFAYLRPDAVLDEGAKAGTFVEIKNSRIGAGAKVPHLSYVGDADVGEKSNLGAGTITANYDGKHKHRTTIGRSVRVSVHTALVAPVTVGDDAYTGAGSVITTDIPAGALGIARERQCNVEGYAQRRK